MLCRRAVLHYIAKMVRPKILQRFEEDDSTEERGRVGVEGEGVGKGIFSKMSYQNNNT